MTTPTLAATYVFKEPRTDAGKLALFDHLLSLRTDVGEDNVLLRTFPILTEEGDSYVLRVRVRKELE